MGSLAIKLAKTSRDREDPDSIRHPTLKKKKKNGEKCGKSHGINLRLPQALLPNVTERFGPSEPRKMSSGHTLYPPSSQRSVHTLRRTPHSHEHVPVHVPCCHQISGRMERQATGWGFQHDVFWGITDPGCCLRGVKIFLFIVRVLCRTLRTHGIHRIHARWGTNYTDRGVA